MSFESDCRRLHLTYTREHFREHIREAVEQAKSYEEFLAGLLKAEVDQRNRNMVQKRIQEAHFPNRMLLADFRRDHLDPDIQKSIRILSTLEFIENGENVVMVGNPGTGKTALACCLGMEACLKGKSVLFVRASDLLVEIREAMSQERIRRYRKKFVSYDLVILDELGYCSFDEKAGEVLFSLLSARSESGTIILTSNLMPEQWIQVFRDEVTTGAVTDRLMHKCYALDMTGDSYRVIETRRWMNEKFQE